MSKKPINSVYEQAWLEINRNKKKWILWIIFLFLFSFLFVGLNAGVIFLPLVFFIGSLLIFMKRVREKFWRQFAEKKRWNYIGEKDVSDEKALMLNEGHNTVITNLIEGGMTGRGFRMFEFKFTVGHGKHKRDYHYTAFGFKFKGRFPHLYLNSFSNGYNVFGKGTHIDLGFPFESKFRLYSPEEYEIEALQVFTPDVLEYLLDEDWPYDVELVGQELLIFRYGLINSVDDLEARFEQAVGLVRHLDSVLDNMNFSYIEGQPYFL